MIENFWKQNDIKSNFPLAKNLKDLTEAITKWANNKGQVICSFSVNGLSLTEGDEHKFSQTKVDDVSTIAAYSSTPDSLLDESLMECREHIQKLIGAYERLSRLFKEDDISFATKLHQKAMDGLKGFIELVTHYKVVHHTCRGDLGPQWDRLQSHIPVVLGQILAAYEKKDYSLVADLLEYEMLGLLGDWKQEIDSIIAKNSVC